MQYNRPFGNSLALPLTSSNSQTLKDSFEIVLFLNTIKKRGDIFSEGGSLSLTLELGQHTKNKILIDNSHEEGREGGKAEVILQRLIIP
jgi:hypothetical protein